jgi:hypothetical protein
MTRALLLREGEGERERERERERVKRERDVPAPAPPPVLGRSVRIKNFREPVQVDPSRSESIRVDPSRADRPADVRIVPSPFE